MRVGRELGNLVFKPLAGTLIQVLAGHRPAACRHDIERVGRSIEPVGNQAETRRRSLLADLFLLRGIAPRRRQRRRNAIAKLDQLQSVSQSSVDRVDSPAPALFKKDPWHTFCPAQVHLIRGRDFSKR
jgi:hypothetical protein